SHEPYLVKALIDILSDENIIRKSLVEKLGIKYSKDKLVSGSDEVLNNFVVYKEPKADFVLGIPWLWLHETKIDPYNEKISIYSKVISFYKNPSYDLESDISSTDIS
ncbi:24259_t:CDS:2, partial [Dentiscutata erythropus]